MNPDRWRLIDELFHQAQAVEPSSREAWLSDQTDGNVDVKCAVLSLLAADAKAGEFLSVPAIDSSALGPLRGSLQRAAGDVEDLSGTHAGAYILQRRIGAGGMGAVYLAQRDDQAYRKEVAVKILKRGLDTDELLARFRNERQVLAGLEHPNIARLIDGGATNDGRPYLVMEYVDGEPLDIHCDNRRLSIDDRLQLFLAICDAVQFAHQRLVIHRDVKPGNILVTADGIPKLVDFGIAKVLSSDSSLPTMTAAGVRLLSPRYASPEQIRGEAITTASDVYSLGVVLYELMTGHSPYPTNGDVRQTIEAAACETEPVRPSAAATRVSTATGAETKRAKRRLSGDLDNIILKALRKDIQRRYATVEQLSEDLRRHLKQLPVSARPDTLRYRTKKFIARNRAAVSASALVALIIACVVGGIMRQAAVTAANARTARQVNAKFHLAYTLFVQGPTTYDQVEPMFRDVLATSIDILPENDETRTSATNCLASILLTSRRIEECERLVEPAIQVIRASYEKDHPLLLRMLGTYSSVLEKLNKLSEAEQAAKEAYEGYRRTLGPTHAYTLPSLIRYCDVLAHQGRLAQAEKILTNEYDFRIGAIGHEEQGSRSIARRLHGLYRAWHTFRPNDGYDEKAEQWRSRASDPGGNQQRPTTGSDDDS